MLEISTLLQQGSSNAWLFIPSAILLGALHGLEPGHSKTMMAAFIVAIHGTIGQAIMLGLAATVSHTAIVWVIALAGLHFGSQWSAETTEPYFQLASGIIMVCIALWILWRTRQQSMATHDHHDHNHNQHRYVFMPAHSHDHTHEHQDAHERVHAKDIEKRFANQKVTNQQIILFGLTGGLIPCPAAITVLLLCLQLKKITLGITLVLCFSIGLALTMVISGVLAALSVRHAQKHWAGFGDIARKAPYVSGSLILMIGLYMGYQALANIIIT